MAKKVAILVVNPVNGFGLFQYLESFFENGIPFRTFAVADTEEVITNSGVTIKTDDVVANLKGHETEYGAMVFACGDAVPKFGENSDKSYNRDMLAVIKNFADNGSMMIGHCAAATFFDGVGGSEGKKVALHPFVKSFVKKVVGTDEPHAIDGIFYTAQTENTLSTLIPHIIKALK